MYHASPIGDIQVLEPRMDSSPGIEGAQAYPRVFASNDPAYAAGHGFRWQAGTQLGFDKPGTPIKLTVPAGMQQCLEQPLFMYVLPADEFFLLKDIQPSGYNYASNQPVSPLWIKRFESVRTAFEFYGGTIEIRTLNPQARPRSPGV